MSKKLLIMLVAFAVLCLPHAVSAHVFVKDSVQGVGAILHINPDDDPVAGEPASLFFDIQDGGLAQEQPEARLVITDDRNNITAVTAKLSGSAVSADYTFPKQGLYAIRLTIIQDGKLTHDFTVSQRVSRGALGGAAAGSTPVWAQAGMLFSALAAAVLAIIAFNRRRGISKYST